MIRSTRKKAAKNPKKSDKKEKKQKHKEKKKRDKKVDKLLKLAKEISTNKSAIENAHDNDDYCGPSIDLMNRAKCPETKAEFDHRQSQIKRVVDPETGRVRLIKGDGEILEEIVTRDRHKQINQDATRNDGHSFQKNTVGAARK